MNGVTMNSAKALTEKLALTRELATLKPELEYLRSQAQYQQTILAEKLALQRQVSTLEVELETEKRASQRVAERSKNRDRELELQQQVDDLQKDLARERMERENQSKEATKEIESGKRALKRAIEQGNDKEREEELEQQLKDLRRDLAREKRDRAKERMENEKDLEAERKVAKRAAEKVTENERTLDLQEQIEYLRKDLAREKQEAEKCRSEAEKELEAANRASKHAAEKANFTKEKDQELHEQLDKLQKELVKERLDSEKLRKEAQKELTASETRKEVLESQLERLRTKLRSAKEELRESEARFTQACIAAANAGPSRGYNPSKNPRKRGAMEMSTGDPIGTPDGVAARKRGPAPKRGRPDHTILGEKSMFSITPFLNKTINIGIDSPIEEEGCKKGAALVEVENSNTQQEIEVSPKAQVDDTATPSAPKTKARKKPAERKANVEERDLGDTKTELNSRKPAPKKSQSLRKLEKLTEEEAGESEVSGPARPKVDATTANAVKSSNLQLKTTEEAQPHKKKRKLLGGGKTLFDDEDSEATKRAAKVNLGPPRLLGKDGLKAGIGSTSGFDAFSPLKKDRRGIGASFLA
jgi:hypothetical protein